MNNVDCTTSAESRVGEMEMAAISNLSLAPPAPAPKKRGRKPKGFVQAALQLPHQPHQPPQLNQTPLSPLTSIDEGGYQIRVVSESITETASPGFDLSPGSVQANAQLSSNPTLPGTPVTRHVKPITGVCLREAPELEHPEQGLAQFAVDHATRCAATIVTACAVDGRPYWKTLFACGMADAISEDLQIENEFLGRLCSQPGLPYAAEIVRGYLEQMPADRKERLLSANSIKRKTHPANDCLYGATFMTQCGYNLLAVLQVMIEHGMPIQPLMDRNHNEVERAALLCNRPFMTVVCGAGGVVSDDLIRSIMSRSSRQIEAISLMIDMCNVSIQRFCTPKLMALCNPKTRSYINARLIRESRVPTLTKDPEDEEATEGA